MAPKSIYRRPEAQHFQLVHRSQRDPLIHDPDASQHVLKPFQRENDVKKGKSRADLEALLEPEERASRPNVGEASLYGVYYDDTEYDYMQHLRETGVAEDGVEAIMLEAPAPRKEKGKSKGIELRLPPEALPSTSELDLPQAYDARKAVPDALAGFQPDMDPHLRQVLEALEEDAFVDDALGDDFFGELLEDGERNEGDHVDFEYAEEGAEEASILDGDGPESWEVRFAQFQKEKQDAPAETAPSEMSGYSEGADTLGRLPVIGGKRRRRAGSESSGFSMTSSAVFRNEGLTTLDQRFDQVEKTYDESDDDDISDDDAESDEVPDLLKSREDLEAVMDDFLTHYELVGRRMQPVLPGASATDKLDTIRRALGSARLDSHPEDDRDTPMPHDIDAPKDRWDCETVLSMHTNLENRPCVIKAWDDKPVSRIRLDRYTGLPIPEHREQEDVAVSQGDKERSVHTTISRPRDESKEHRKARKQAVKQNRQARRVEKKATREQFLTERKHQVKVHANKPLSGVRKL